MRLSIGFKTTPVDVDWTTLDETWAAAGELSVFDSGWMSDHLVNVREARGGRAWESFVAMAALAYRVPGKWLGHAVLANTLRHPAVLAKQATVMDNVTHGRFIVGLGAGWHEAEHLAFGIPLPPVGERIDRFGSALRVLHALFSAEARANAGVTLDDRFYPLQGATNLPPPMSAEGPPIWTGAQQARGMRLTARYADGWLLPGDKAGDTAYYLEKRDALWRALEAAERAPETFTIAAQVTCGDTAQSRAAALDAAIAMARAGSRHIILGVTARLGPKSLLLAAREVGEPLREAVE